MITILYKRLLPTLLISSLLVTSSFATDVTTTPTLLDTAGTDHEMPVLLEVESLHFEVSVPTSLPVFVDVEGNVTVATNASIINNSNKDIQVTDITFTKTDDTWSMKPYDNEMGDNEYGLLINGNKSGDGTLSWNNFRVNKSKEVPVSYDLKIKEGTEGVAPVELAKVTMTVDWFVRKEGQLYSGDELYDGSILVSMNEPYRLETPTTYSIRSTPTWISSDEEIATISEDGWVDCIKPGRVTMSYGEYEVPIHVYGTQVEASINTINLTSSDLVIPDHYEKDGNWYTITAVGDNGFKSSSITSVVIPDTIIAIKSHAFSGTNLSSIDIPNSVIKIGYCAFSNCTSLQSVIVPSSVIDFSTWVFSDCSGLVSAELYTDKVPNYIFRNCTKLETVKVYGDVKCIDEGAFMLCSSLQDVYLPKSIEEIKYFAFDKVSNVLNVNYEGSTSDWSVITIGSSNGGLLTCTKNYEVSY